MSYSDLRRIVVGLFVIFSVTSFGQAQTQTRGSVAAESARKQEPAAKEVAQTAAESKPGISSEKAPGKDTSDSKDIRESDELDIILGTGQSPIGVETMLKPDVQDVKANRFSDFAPSPDKFVSRRQSSQPQAQDDAAKLARQLQNPIAALILVPYELDYDGRKGATNSGETWTNILQPLIPFKINDKWNLISRTIIPFVIYNNDLPTDGVTSTGIGDITQEFWFSPAESTKEGIIWGGGPSFVIPNGTDGKFSSGKWSIGPTFLIMRQQGPLAYGQLTNQFWSFAGDSNREDTNLLFLQPFISYTLKTHTSFFLETESNYNWKAKNWSVPLNVQVKQLFFIQKQPFQIGAGAAYWATSPPGGPEGVGVRFFFVAMFPQ